MRAAVEKNGIRWNEGEIAAAHLDPGDYQLTLTVSGPLSRGNLLIQQVATEAAAEQDF